MIAAPRTHEANANPSTLSGSATVATEMSKPGRSSSTAISVSCITSPVRSAARTPAVELDELVSAGTFGLIRALDSFDLSRGLAFSTYAVRRIRGAILDDLRSRDWTPRSARMKSRRLAATVAELQGTLGRQPRPREVAAALGIPLEDFSDSQDARPIRSENRALLIASIAQGRRWLSEIMTNPTVKAESIAVREGCSARQVNMTISLAFLAPDLVKAAIEGRLPHGHGVTRMRDLPAEWARQRQMLGL